MTPFRNRRARPRAATLAMALMLAGLVPASAGAAEEGVAAAQDSVAVRVEVPAVAWLNYREAKSTARHAERPLMIYFSEGRNMDCGRLDREVWTDPNVRSYVNDRLVTARVDVKDSPSVASYFNVDEVPTLLFLAPDGEALVVLRGLNDADAILRVAEFVCSKAYEFTDYATWKSRNPGP